MGLFDKLVLMFTGRPSAEVSREAAVSRPERMAPVPNPSPVASISVTFSGPSTPAAHVSDAEVAEAAKPYAFVLTNELPPLKVADQWWEEATHKRRLREGSEKAYAWLLPFIPLEVAKLEQLQKAQQWGPHGANSLAKALRALIRERRKAKQPHEDLLQALYGACVLADLAASLGFEGIQPHAMTRYVDIKELPTISRDLAASRYKYIQSMSKTDAKWLTEVFGEPVEYQPFDVTRTRVRENAISRYCWSALEASSSASRSLGLPQKRMQAWLDEQVKRNIGYQKDWQDRVAVQNEHREEAASALEAAWAATAEPFIVADLETTGLSAENDELLEFAAVAVDAVGLVTSEFAMLVRVTRPVPPAITKITGITQADVDRQARPLDEAMRAFLAFVGSRPVFFHNAPFDSGFLKMASAQTGLTFANAVHDTLPLARGAWPSAGVYKLAALAERVGAPAPTHRALADAKAALAVLLAARNIASPAHGGRRE